LEELLGIIEAMSGPITAYIVDQVGIGDEGLSVLRDRFLQPAG